MSDMENIVKQDVVQRQMSALQTDTSQPFKSGASASLLDHSSSEAENIFNVTESEAASKESSVDRDFMEQINVKDLIDQNDEDIIMEVLRESDINFNDIPIDIEGIKVQEDNKAGVIIVDGASARTEIDYDKLHAEIKSMFQETEDGYSVAELTLVSHFSDVYNSGFNHHHHFNPGFNHLAYEHDHSYDGTPKLEPRLEDASTSRRRNVSESSGYTSMTEEMSRPESSAWCKDEADISFNGLSPQQIINIINIINFTELLTRPGRSPLNVCHDIRRRGKNKVAARNCRKMDAKLQLQHQADQVR